MKSSRLATAGPVLNGQDNGKKPGLVSRVKSFRKDYPSAWRFLLWDTIIAVFLLVVQVVEWHG